jgi:hypothetical protein
MMKEWIRRQDEAPPTLRQPRGCSAYLDIGQSLRTMHPRAEIPNTVPRLRAQQQWVCHQFWKPYDTGNSSNGSGSSVFTGEAAAAYDFRINIAGLFTLTIGSVNASQNTELSQTSQYIGIAFSESSLCVSNRSSDATAEAGKDETLWFAHKRYGTVCGTAAGGQGRV